MPTAFASRATGADRFCPKGVGVWLADDLARSVSKPCNRYTPDPPRRLILLPVPGRSLASRLPRPSARIKSRRRNSPKLLEELV
jgi:hypothetical protein